MLVDPQDKIADLERQLAECTAERDEAVLREMAAAETLQIINRSPGELKPVFDAILKRAHTLCGADEGAFGLFTGDTWRAVATRGYRKALAAKLRQGTRAADNPLIQPLFDGARLVHAPDVQELDHPIVQVAESGIHTVLVVPLRRGGALLGTISASRRVVRPFSDRQIALLEHFAAQAVIAIENARLVGELRERTGDLEESLEYQTATSEVLQVISRSAFDLQPILETALESAIRLCGATRGHVLTADGEFLRLAAAAGAWPGFVESLEANPLRIGPGSAAGRAVAERRIVQIDDVLAEPEYEQLALVKEQAFRTVLAVPMLRDDVLLGVIVILKSRVEPFTDRQIALVSTFADQAVIAMENARLLTETREALEQQTATAEILRVISRSPDDVQPTFDAIVGSASKLCEAEFSAVARFEDGVLHLVATNNLSPEEAAAFHSLFPRPPSRDFVMGRAFIDACAVQFDDVLAKADYDPRSRQVLQVALGYRTFMAVPIFRAGTPIGVIGCARRQVKPFSATQIRLLETFAEQAAIALDNVRLFTELRQRTNDLEVSLEYQTATSDVLQVISRSTFDLQPVLDTFAETALRLCVADQAYVIRREGEVYRSAAATGSSPADKLAAARYHEYLQVHPIGPGRGTLTGRVAQERRAIQIDDVATDPEYTLTEAVTLGSIHTQLGVPLLRAGEPIGLIVLSRRRVEPFTEGQIELVRTFADQAVIAIENTRLLTELRESLEQQTATAEVLQVINSSPGELAPVFDAMLERAMRLCGAAFGGLGTWQEDRFQFVAVRGPEPLVEHHARNEVSLGSREGFARVARGEGYVQFTDISTSELYQSGEPYTRALVDLCGGRTTLSVPLTKDGDVLGVLAFFRQEVRAFSDKEIALVRNFAAQAVIAMENARLLTETREALEQQTATSEVLRVISGSPGDLAPVFQTALENAVRLCEAKFASLYLREADGFRGVAMHNVPPALAEARTSGLLRPPPDSPLARIAATKQVVHISDIRTMQSYIEGHPFAVAGAELGGYRTVLSVPMLKDNEVIGAININRQEVRPFTDRQIELVRNFAAQAVIAMENARLINETRAALDQQTAVADVLKVISHSTFDLPLVLETLVETAVRLCDADHGYLFRLQDGRHHLAASVGAEPKFKAFMANNPFQVDRGTLSGRVALEKRVVHLDDAANDPDYTWSEAQRRGNLRTGLGVPLFRENTVIGIVVLYRSRVERFTEKQIALVKTFADQAVIAIENARLLGELRDREAELRVTFDNMVDGVAMFDEGLHLAAWNRNFQRFLDLPDDFLAERPDFDSYIGYLTERGEFGERDVATEVRRLRARIDDHYSFERSRPDGTVMEVRHNPMPGGGIVLIYSDITERKRSEEEIRAARDAAERALQELQAAQANLVHAQKMAALGQLTAGIAHEIKNPLNFVNNFADLSVELLDELKASAEPAFAGLEGDARADVDETIAMLTSNMAKIAEHGRRADGIVRSMLAHSRGGSGDWQEVDLNALIEEALQLAYHGARAQDQGFNITLERDLAAELAPIEVVPQDVTRVFLNLFGNGFYAANKQRAEAGSRPVLKVTTRDLGEAVEIRVRDNGTGIAPEIRDRLFQPFFTTKPTGEGTGLGLSISYDIVTQQHGGTLEVDSEPGAFTEFIVRLPRERHTSTAGSTA